MLWWSGEKFIKAYISQISLVNGKSGMMKHSFGWGSFFEKYREIFLVSFSSKNGSYSVNATWYDFYPFWL